MKALLPFLLSVCAVPAFAVPTACSGDSLPRLEIVARLAQPALDRTTARAELTQIAELSRPGEADGLTDFQFRGDVQTFADGRKGACPVGAVRVEIAPERAFVYIAREVEENSCRFKAVFDHEMKHVMLAQQALDKHSSRLRRKLREGIATAARTDGQPLDQESLAAFVDGVVRETLEGIKADYRAGNEALDTDEEARRLASMCQDPEVYVGSAQR